MRIGIDCRFYSSKFTGIGRYTFELVKHLLEIDKKNEYVLFFNEPEFRTESRELRAENCKKVLVNAKHYSLREQTVFLKKLYKEKLDLMHFTHFNAPILYRKSCIVTIHDLTPSFFPGKKFNKIYRKLAYNVTIKSIINRAKKIIAVSNNTAKDIIKVAPKTKSKIITIYESVAKEFSKKPNQKNLESTKKKFNLNDNFLLYTGVWRDHKNVVGLIKAFEKVLKAPLLPARHGSGGNGAWGLQLVITGKEDPFYPEVKETVKALKLENDVIFTGFVPEEELLSLYHLCKAYVFPSFYEGFGLPVLEAFACDKPLICSNKSSLPEVAGKDNAVFFNPYDVNDMAEKILKVLSDENLQKKLIENGQKRLKNFSWKKMAEETLRVYQNTQK